MMHSVPLSFAMLAGVPLALAPPSGTPPPLACEVKDTPTALEMNHDDIVTFRLRNGQTRTLVLKNTAAEILLSNLKASKKAQGGGGTLYRFTADVVIDGHPMTLERYVCSQESFYEPYVINGMRIWFDAVSDIFAFANENHGPCKPSKHARFALQDASERICPEQVLPWCPNGKNMQSKGTPNWAPIDFDDHYLFNSLAGSDNNNRWRGIRGGQTATCGRSRTTTFLTCSCRNTSRSNAGRTTWTPPACASASTSTRTISSK